MAPSPAVRNRRKSAATSDSPKLKKRAGAIVKTTNTAVEPWDVEARAIVKAALVRQNWDYETLSKALEPLGENLTPKNLSLRIQRGTFSFAFALKVFKALGLTDISLS